MLALTYFSQDLKAYSILVDAEGTCKIAGFDNAKRVVSKETLDQRYDSSLVGTIFWMAPEVIAGKICSKIDIWSFGCVLLEMWSGRRPWDGYEMITVMFKLHESKMAPPVPEDNQLSEVAEQFRLRCFEA